MVCYKIAWDKLALEVGSVKDTPYQMLKGMKCKSSGFVFTTAMLKIALSTPNGKRCAMLLFDNYTWCIVPHNILKHQHLTTKQTKEAFQMYPKE